MRKYGRTGWFGESHRHYLASKGVKTASKHDWKYHAKKEYDDSYEEERDAFVKYLEDQQGKDYVKEQGYYDEPYGEIIKFESDHFKDFEEEQNKKSDSFKVNTSVKDKELVKKRREAHKDAQEAYNFGKYNAKKEDEKELEYLYEDFWGRPVFEDVKTKQKFAEVDGKMHTVTHMGEPDMPVRGKYKVKE